MPDRLRLLFCLLPFLVASCTFFVAGTTEETNALADNISSSSELSSETDVKSSSSIWQGIPDTTTYVPDSSTTLEPDEHNVMLARYWRPYYNSGVEENQLDVQIETDEDENIYVSYKMDSLTSESDQDSVAVFGVEIRVDEEGGFSEIKTWTGGACYMVQSDVPLVLKMGMSPEKEKELEYDLPQATLVGPSDVGNLVIKCVSWRSFKQQGFGPTITIEEAFFDYMTTLRFEAQLENGNHEGSFKISEIRASGSGISADIDGTQVTVNEEE
ncbi:MAG: hypothetical protein IK012_00020 [Fibrobacter sp.]|uniref:hypothetical protein n=1 Tax=Fibrobacter sp. TaxID=35828 RepID=UPI0025B95C64|nr:hypothetical protein [Fibrobacter sp.]MBR4783630.1 hypothetical protein [Fibrobacter sp.]